jgi:tetratricopeptide (TPR) repeat protein
MNASFDRSLALNPKHQKDIAQGRQKYYVEHYNKGVQAVQADNFANAAKAFEKAAIIDPGQIEAFKNLAFCQYKLSQPDKALATYEQALALSSEDADILTKMASIHYEQGDYEKAATVFEEISRLGEANAQTLSSLASAYERLKQPDRAIAAYEKAAALNPEDENLLYNIAVLYSNQEKYDRAIEYYKQVLQLDPDDSDAKFNLALIYVLKLEQWDDALPILKELIEAEPCNAEAWEMLSMVYARKDKVAESEDAYMRSKLEGAGGGFCYGNVSSKAGLFGVEYIGEITNGSGQDYQLANFVLSVYDEDRRLLGTVYISISNIGNDVTKSFQTVLTNTSLSRISTYKIQFENGF